MLLVVLYSITYGPLLGSRVQTYPPPLEITSVEIKSILPHQWLQITLRNNQLHPIRGEVGYELAPPGENARAYASRSMSFGVLAPLANMQVLFALPDELSTENVSIGLYVRENLAYVDPINFELSRITPTFRCTRREEETTCTLGDR